MKKNILIYILFVVAFGVTSCVKDNSTVAYKALNNVVITNFNDSVAYTAQLGEPFIIEPTITANDDDLSFVWFIHSTAVPRDTISTEKTLNVVLGGADATPGVDYKLVYRVTDNKTGVFTELTGSLLVESDYTSGMLILCENESKVRLNLKKPNGTLAESLFELNNGIELEPTTARVHYINPNIYRPYMKSVLLFGKSYDGGYTLDPITLTKQNTIREAIDVGYSNEGDIDAYYCGRLGNIEYLIVNGNLHKRATNMGALPWEATPLVSWSGEGSYSVKQTLSMNSQPILFDVLNGRFLFHTPWNMGALNAPGATGTTTTHFDPNNMGNYEHISQAKMGGAVNYCLIARERTTGAYTAFKFQDERVVEGRNTVCNIITHDKVAISDAQAPNFKDNIACSNHPYIDNFVFYTANNKVYSLNALNLSSSSSALAESELVDLSATNMIITGMEVSDMRVPDTDSAVPNAVKLVDAVTVYVQDNSLTSQKGGYIIYQISTQGGINLIEVDRYIGGYCDKIIDIDYKVN